jgi:hypothetical protein
MLLNGAISPTQLFTVQFYEYIITQFEIERSWEEAVCPVLWKYPGIRVRKITEISDSTVSDSINSMSLQHISETFHRLNHHSLSTAFIGSLFNTVFSFRISKWLSNMERTRIYIYIYIYIYIISSLGQLTKSSPPDKYIKL